MRKVLLTENKNILIYDPFLKNRGLTLQANEYVELAVSYEDRFQQPITRRRLMWKITEGKANLQQPTTVTNGRGKGINKIKVKLDDPKASATVRVAVWPLDEPCAVLEIECNFGAPKAAPAASGNVLRSVYPCRAVNTHSDQEIITFKFIYSDPYGDLIPDKEVNFTYNTAFTEKVSDYDDNFYWTYKGKKPQIGLNGLILKADNNASNLTFGVEYDDNKLTILNNYWPPSQNYSLGIDTICQLKGNSLYKLKVYCCDNNGNGFRDKEITWKLAQSGPKIRIYPPSSLTNADGIATSTLICEYDPTGQYNSFSLDVGINNPDASTEVRSVSGAYTIIPGMTFSSVTPSPASGMLVFGQSIPFTVTAVDPSGNIAETGVTWNVAGANKGKFYFDPGYTPFDQNGEAKSTLKATDLQQGVQQDIQVTITGQDGEEWIGEYSVGSRVLKRVTPLGSGPYPTGEAVPVTVKLYGPDGVTPQPYCPLVITPNEYVSISPKQLNTREDGSATFTVTANAACSVSIQIGEYAGPVPTPISMDFGLSDITIIPPAPSAMQYDRRVSVTAQYLGSDGKPAGDKTLKWNATNGVRFISDTSETDADGLTIVEIYYETTTGYPGSGLITTLTAKADDGTRGSQTLEFTRGSALNQINIIKPPEYSKFPVDTEFTVVVQLINDFGHPLTNYRIDWECHFEGVTEIDHDTKTDGDGIATITLARNISGDIIVTALAHDARRSRDIHYDIIEEALPDYTLIYNNIFAHQNTKGDAQEGHEQFPDDKKQILTMAYRCLKNNEPQADKEIIWTYSPATRGLVPFDENKKPIKVGYTGMFSVPTNSQGLSIVNFTGYDPGIYQINAYPKANPEVISTPADIIFATFEKRFPDDDANRLPMAKVVPAEVTIPDILTPDDDSFGLVKPFDEVRSPLDRVVFWIRSGEELEDAEENIRITTIKTAESGILVPYSYLYPSGSDISRNAVNYLITVGGDAECLISKPVNPRVFGTAKSHHPDYNPDKPRPLPAPKLSSHYNIITYTSIINGLFVVVPFDSSWLIDDTIELNLYLNGRNALNQEKGDTIVIEHTISPSDLLAKTDITLRARKEDVVGYFGFLEADYTITKNNNSKWSGILDNILLHTLYPFD
ncbi:hypothetical protein ACI2JN_05205 [Ochrobactrum teleogrylli]|uniref:hypothetical protein n=1 Tax=Ochrobactrum teleogrylli TaxID=2479765 RepID=UPI00384C8FD2